MKADPAARRRPTLEALIRELKRVADGPRGVWGADLAKLPALAGLSVVQSRLPVSPGAHDYQRALAEVLRSALSLDPDDWRQGGLHLLAVSESGKGTWAKTGRQVLAADSHGLTPRVYTREGVRKWAGKSPLALTLEAAAAKLIRYDSGEPAPDRTLPPLDKNVPLDRIAVALRGLGEWDHTSLGIPPRLEGELSTVLADAYHTFHLTHSSKTFVSWTPALALRTDIHDPDDTMFVLSRRDEPLTIQQDAAWGDYKEWLRRQVAVAPLAGTERDGINHVRLIVRDDPAPLKSGADELWEFHGSDSLYTLTSSVLRRRHQLLHDLPFGFILSTKHDFALISIPPLPSNPPFRLEPYAIADFVARCAEHQQHPGGSMQAVVTFDHEFVARLREAFVSARDTEAHTVKLK